MKNSTLVAVDLVESASMRVGFVADAIAAISENFADYDWSGAVLCLRDARADMARAAESVMVDNNVKT